MRVKDYICLASVIATAAICSVVLNNIGVDKVNILMIFMVGVLLVSAFTRGYFFGIVASCASIMIFNYFFTEPLHTFAINSTNDMTLILFFLMASVIASSLTARFQRQLEISKRNEQTAKLLYEITQGFMNVTGEDNIIRHGINYIKEQLGFDSMVQLDDSRKYYSADNISDLENSSGTELPITGIAQKLGTLRVYAESLPDKAGSGLLFNAVAAQMGIALDREFIYNERENTRIAMDREHLKSNLLRSIGHDLRTPLAGIAGASSYINSHAETLEREGIKRLTADINEQAVWLTTLVENILNMTRIDKDELEVNKQIEVVDDVVSEAVTHVIGLNKRPFKIILPNEVVTAPMDGKMIVQVLVNLLDNAVKHTPENCPVELVVSQKEGFVEFSVADGGNGTGDDPAAREKLFDAFITSGKTGADGKKGIGLGLAICKAVIKAHGGIISTGTSHLGGALFTFTLPNGEVKGCTRI